MMLKKISGIGLLLFIGMLVNAQVPALTNPAFAEGEHLSYHINFYSLLTGSVKAGDFELIVDPAKTDINNTSTFHCVARGRTTWAFDFFYKVNDRFESFVDENSLLPLLALRRIRETDFIRDEDLVFDRKSSKVTFKNNIKGKTRIIPASSGTMDILSAVYYLRSVKLPSADGIGDIKISYIFSDSLRTSTIKFLGKETLQTDFGEVECIMIKPQVLKGSVFSSSFPLKIWITNDNNRIPVLVESEIVMGKVRVELVSWKGLKNPFTSLKTAKTDNRK